MRSILPHNAASHTQAWEKAGSGPSTSAPLAPAPWSRSSRAHSGLHRHAHLGRQPLRQLVQPVAAITQSVPAGSTARGEGGFVPGIGPAPGNVTEHAQDGLFDDQLVFSKFTWPAVLGGQDIYIWGERRKPQTTSKHDSHMQVAPFHA